MPAHLPGESDLLHVEAGPSLTTPTLSLHIGILDAGRRQWSISTGDEQRWGGRGVRGPGTGGVREAGKTLQKEGVV